MSTTTTTTTTTHFGVWDDEILVKFSPAIASDQDLNVAVEILDIVEGSDAGARTVMTVWSMETAAKLQERLGDKAIIIRTGGYDTTTIDAFNAGEHQVAIVYEEMAIGYRLNASHVIVVEVRAIASAKQAAARVADPLLTMFVPDTAGREQGAVMSAAPTCACAKHDDGSVTTLLCPEHAAEDPCAIRSTVTGKRRKGTIRNGKCTNCGWSNR